MKLITDFDVFEHELNKLPEELKQKIEEDDKGREIFIGAKIQVEKNTALIMLLTLEDMSIYTYLHRTGSTSKDRIPRAYMKLFQDLEERLEEMK
ncbi:hypothetical protein [Salibacterium lacus]|uniref:Phage protein n=1 Tax=Salibacterium lacus TaxID=1898109 RepID=A0ABW5SWB6_9BACI